MQLPVHVLNQEVVQIIDEYYYLDQWFVDPTGGEIPGIITLHGDEIFALDKFSIYGQNTRHECYTLFLFDMCLYQEESILNFVPIKVFFKAWILNIQATGTRSMLPWWRHQMETFSALLAFCAGKSPIPGQFSAQRPVTRSFDAFFDLHLNKQLSKQSRGWWFETPSGSLWRQCNATKLHVALTLQVLR